MKVLLEQRTKELEERNMCVHVTAFHLLNRLLIKARNAIEILQEQLRNSKKEFEEFAKENSTTVIS